eukprot:4279985-Amphidinium_carterae.3
MMPPASVVSRTAASTAPTAVSSVGGNCELEVTLPQMVEHETGREPSELLVSEHLPATSSTSVEWRIRLTVWKRHSMVDVRRYRTTTGPDHPGPDAQLHYITVSTKQGVQGPIWAPLVKTGQINWGTCDSPRFESNPQQGYQVMSVWAYLSVAEFHDGTHTSVTAFKRGDALGDSPPAATVVSVVTVHHAVTSTHKKGMSKAAMATSCSSHGFGFVIPTLETFRHSGSDSWVAQLEQVDLTGLLGVMLQAQAMTVEEVAVEEESEQLSSLVLKER